MNRSRLRTAVVGPSLEGRPCRLLTASAAPRGASLGAGPPKTTGAGPPARAPTTAVRRRDRFMTAHQTAKPHVERVEHDQHGQRSPAVPQRLLIRIRVVGRLALEPVRQRRQVGQLDHLTIRGGRDPAELLAIHHRLAELLRRLVHAQPRLHGRLLFGGRITQPILARGGRRELARISPLDGRSAWSSSPTARRRT